jgi:DHA1 family tetracycline resistance protein-like MFS transporter
MAGIALSMVILGLAPSLLWLFIGRTFAGICGANISTATAYIADVTSEKDRAKGMGLIGAAFGLGFIFGPVIGGVLSRFGYGVPMFAAAVLSLGNIVFAYFKLAEPPQSEEFRAANRAKRFDGLAFRESMGDPRTRMAILLFFLVTVALTQMEVTFALFVEARHGFDAQGTGWLLAFMGIIMVIVQGGLIGKLSNRLGEVRLILIGTVLMAVALVLMAQAMRLPMLYVGLAVLALGNGVVNPSLSSLASQGALPDRRGATMGVYQSAGSLARVVGPPVAGVLYDGFGIARPFLIAAVLMAVGFWAVLIWQVGSTERMKAAVAVFRAGGIRGLVQAYGWKLVAAFVIYYLIRDMTLYILLPWMAAKGLLSL